MKNLTVLLNKKVTENDCNCEKGREHYSRGIYQTNMIQLKQKNQTPPPPQTKRKCDCIDLFKQNKRPIITEKIVNISWFTRIDPGLQYYRFYALPTNFLVNSFRTRKLLTQATGLRSKMATFTGRYYMLDILF